MLLARLSLRLFAATTGELHQLALEEHTLTHVTSLHSIWGDDADVWNPMRFIDGNINNEVKVGMLGNL